MSSRDPLERLFFFDLQIGDNKVTLNHLGEDFLIFFVCTPFFVSVSETFFDVEKLCCKHTLWGKIKDVCVGIGSKIGGNFLAIFGGWVRYFSKCVSGQKRIHQGYDMKKEIAMYTPEDKRLEPKIHPIEIRKII